MNSLSDDWVDTFVNHPIFQASSAQLKVAQSIYKKKTRQSNPNGDFSLQHHSQLITLRENDLFVAIGSEIRVLNLKTCKDNWMKSAQQSDYDWIKATPYFVLNTPEINFAVESMTANKNGRLLAVKGSHNLVVICLPRQGFSSYTENVLDRKVLCRTLSVGTNFYDTNKSEILKVEWHPLSETRTHIVVLGNDNQLRIFDISMDIEEPEQSFDLSPVSLQAPEKPKSKAGFSVDDEDNTDEDAISFSLGGISKESSGWEPFTVFYSLRNGHIYALCPVVPYRSSIDRSHLDNLSCITNAKCEKTKDSDSEDHKTLSYLYQLQCSWIAALFKSAKIAHKVNNTNSVDLKNLVVSSSFSFIDYPVQRQGPFLVNQAIDLQVGTEASDILYINVDSISIIALAFTDGTVHNYIVGSEVDPQWQMPTQNAKHGWQKKLGYLLSTASFLPSASLYEVLNIKSPASPNYQSMIFVTDPLYEDTYYLYHAAGVHAVSMNKWVQKLSNINACYEAGQNKEAQKALETWLKEKPTSEISVLVDSSPFSSGYVPIVGLIVISDMYLSYSVFALTLNYQLVFKDLFIRRDPMSFETSHDAIKLQLKDLQNQDTNAGESYQSLLPLPAFQPPSQLSSLPKQPKIVVPAKMSGTKEVVINEESLRFFSGSSIEVRRQTRDIKKIATKIDARLSIQQKEFERQVASLRDLYGRLQKVNSPAAKADRDEKLQNICRNHAKLRLRIDEQLRKLMKSYQPELSHEEKAWITKLEKISEKISGDFGYAARVDLLKSQIKDLEPSTIKRENLSKLNQAQLKTILRTLKQQGVTIDEVGKRFKELESQISLTSN